MNEEIKIYIEKQIEEVEERLFKSIDNEDFGAGKKNNAILYQLKFLRDVSEYVGIGEFKKIIESIDETLDDEIDSYLDMIEDISNDTYYVCSTAKRSILRGIIMEIDKLSIYK